MTTTIDQQFIEYVIKTLVGNPSAVSIERTIDDKGILLLLTVDPEDLGRVIGKKGVTAQSLRTLLRALGTKNGERYNLKIVDNGEFSSSSESNDSNKSTEAENVGQPEADESSENDSQELESVRRTRAELADLDDLDI